MDWSKIVNSIGLTQNNNNNMWGAIASAGAGLLGGLFNSSSQDKANKAQLEFARQQFATQVGMYNQGLEFNKAEAQRARDYNTSMLQYQNSYNTPAQQIQRMRAAGLNPDLMYGNGQLGASSASGNGSPAASAPGAPSGTSVNPQSTRVGDAIMNALSIERQRAEIDAIKANTAKTGTENQILQTEASFVGAIRENDVALQKLGIINADKSNHLKDAELEQLRVLTQNYLVERSKVGEEIKLLQEQFAGVTIVNALKRVDLYFKSDIYRADLNKLKAEYKLTQAQADKYAEEAEARIKRDLSAQRLSDAQASNVEQTTDLQKQDFDYSQPFKQLEQTYYNDILGEKVLYKLYKGMRFAGETTKNALPAIK